MIFLCRLCVPTLVQTIEFLFDFDTIFEISIIVQYNHIKKKFNQITLILSIGSRSKKCFFTFKDPSTSKEEKKVLCREKSH